MPFLDAFGLTKLYATRSLFVAFVGVVLLFLGCLGPWASASGTGLDQTSYGFDLSSGKVLLVASLVAAFSLLRYADQENPQLLLLVLAIGIGTAIVGIFEFSRFEKDLGNDFGAGDAKFSASWGLWIAIAGSAVVAAVTAITAFAASDRERSET